MASSAPKKTIMCKIRHCCSKQYDFAIGFIGAGVLMVFFVMSLSTFVGVRNMSYAFLDRLDGIRQIFNLSDELMTHPRQLEVVIAPQLRIGSQELALQSVSAAIAVDVETGEILYGKNENVTRAIASITKLLTAMIVVDQVPDLNQVTSVSAEALAVEGTRVGCSSSSNCEGEQLSLGEQIRVQDLLELMLVGSANDAATQLAIELRGSEFEFAKLMNLRAAELNMHNTNSCRASGLELNDPQEVSNCFATAKDVGLLISHIDKTPKYQIIRDILQKERMVVESADGKKRHVAETTNDLLESGEYVLYGKTGTTPRAGQSFSAVASPVKEVDHSGELGHKVAIVVLNSGDRFGDTSRIAKWVFDNYVWSD